MDTQTFDISVLPDDSEDVAAVLRYTEDENSRNLPLSVVWETINISGLLDSLCDWHEEADRTIVITIKPDSCCTILTQITVEVNGQEVADVNGWKLAEAVAFVAETLERKIDDTPTFGRDLMQAAKNYTDLIDTWRLERDEAVKGKVE